MDKNIKNKIELLAPAGDMERLRVAVAHGADAVYLGGTALGLRAKAKNFNDEQLEEAVKHAHAHGVKIFVTANVFAHNEDYEGMEEYFQKLYAIGVDALIISDPGVFSLARQAVPEMEIHVSTQANIVSHQSALFWAGLGASRVVLARELSLAEIKEIHTKVDGKIILENFVHGSMCVAYSGRCLLSAFITHRGANRGECTNACRFKYALMEEKRVNDFYPVYEEDGGTFILNSKDLCMVGHLPQMIDAGIASLKIEGRMKTPFYVATVVKTYREAIDDYFADPELYESKKDYYLNELLKSSNREFCTGFYLGNPGTEGQIYHDDVRGQTYNFLAIVKDYDEATQVATLEQRNKFAVGDEVEVLRAGRPNFAQKVVDFTDEEGNPIQSAPHAQQILKLKMEQPVKPLDILRGRV
ncbi:MAG: U32 family peptidase [Defluviitaleaceae bacterium]|nr:U32 family peptidase [Defluviitaleaceae bacterium]